MTDIKKTLRLETEVDLSKARRELEKLQSEISKGLSIDSSVLADFRKEFKTIAKDFAADIRKELKGLSKGVRASQPSSTPTGTGTGSTARRGRPYDLVYDSARQRQNRVYEDEVYNKTTGRKYKAHGGKSAAEISEQATRDLREKQRLAKEDRDKKLADQARRREDKEQSRSESRIFDAKKGYTRLREGQIYSRTLGKAYDSERDRASAIVAQLRSGKKLDEKTALSEAGGDPNSRRKILKEIGRQKAQENSRAVQVEFQKRMELRKSLFAREKADKLQLLKLEERKKLQLTNRIINATKDGLSKIFGKSMGGFAGEKIGRAMVSKSSAAGLAGRTVGSLGVGVGGAAMVGVGAAAAGVLGGRQVSRSILSNIEKQRGYREQIAGAQFEQSSLVSQGNVSEAFLRSKARKKEVGFGTKVLAGFTGGLSGAWSGLMGEGSPIEGAKRGYEATIAEEGRRYGDVATAQARPLVDAMDQVLLPNIGTRLQTLAGTNITDRGLNQLQNRGADYGFGIQGTNSRMQQAIGALGGRAFEGQSGVGLAGKMFEQERRLGIGTGETASMMEMLRGESGLSVGESFTKQKDLIKTSMAAGLDASKTSKFLQTTSDYISSNAGAATLDTDQVSKNISELMASYAVNSGRTTATTADLRRARDTEETLERESITRGGLAETGKYLAIQNALKESGASMGDLGLGGYMLLSSFSRNAKESDIKKVVSRTKMSEEAQSKFAKSFKGSLQGSLIEQATKGLGAGDDTNLITALRGNELRLKGEDALAEMEAIRGADGALSKVKGQVPGAVLGGTFGAPDEFSVAVSQSSESIKRFNAAFKGVPEVADSFLEALKKLTTDLGVAQEAVKSLSPPGTSTISPAYIEADIRSKKTNN